MILSNANKQKLKLLNDDLFYYIIKTEEHTQKEQFKKGGFDEW